MSRTSRMLGAIAACLLASILPWMPAHAASRPAPMPPGWPKLLTIPGLQIQAPVEPIAMTSVQDIEAPHQMGDVAWYSRGHRPGEQGRAQIFGHLDSVCCPAVFYHLNELRRGALIQVTYRTGQSLTFRVEWQATYLKTALPTAFMYGPTRDHGLILITCAGIFHRDGTGYDHRLMVYATLVHG